MRRAALVLISVTLGAVLWAGAPAPQKSAKTRKTVKTGKDKATVDGKAALQHVVALTQLGPRPSGSPAHLRMHNYIRAALASWSVTPSFQTFDAPTPLGRSEERRVGKECRL